MPSAAEKAVKSDNGSRVIREDLEAEIAQLKNDLAKLAKQLQSTGGHSYGAARRVAAEGVDHLRAQGEAAMDKMRAGAGDLETRLEEAVREKPLTSLGVALGVGFMLALLTRR
ncbi:YqjD family protein [Rhizobiaceae sp. 2RAB30]